MLAADTPRGSARTDSCGRSRRKRGDITYWLAVIAGSGMGAAAEGFHTNGCVSFADIAGVGRCTVDGHRGEVLLCDVDGIGVMFVLGRRHVYEGDPDAMRHLLRWIRQRGVTDLVVASAAGSLRTHITPGEFVVIRDAIDLQCRPPSPGGPAVPRGERLLCVHGGLTHALEDAAWRAGVGCERGTLACLSGPAYESPAEVMAAQRTGADVVTMSAAPEILYAGECGMRVAALAAVTNHATGVGHAVPDHADVLANAWHMSRQLGQIVRQLVAIKWVE